MTEKEFMWAILKSDPACLAHTMAQHLTEFHDEKELNRQADTYLSQLLSTFRDAEILARIVKTWLSEYNVALNPSLLESFDAWHEFCSYYIVHNAKNIQVYQNPL